MQLASYFEYDICNLLQKKLLEILVREKKYPFRALSLKLSQCPNKGNIHPTPIWGKRGW